MEKLSQPSPTKEPELNDEYMNALENLHLSKMSSHIFMKYSMEINNERELIMENKTKPKSTPVLKLDGDIGKKFISHILKKNPMTMDEYMK